MAQPIEAEIDAGDDADPRFSRRDGFLVFTGVIATEDVPDHRALREERIDALLDSAPDART